MREIERGYLDLKGDKILALCSKYSTKSYTHKFCPGIEVSEYETLFVLI